MPDPNEETLPGDDEDQEVDDTDADGEGEPEYLTGLI